jgi:hypothetical protein
LDNNNPSAAGINTSAVRRALDDLGIAYQSNDPLPNRDGLTLVSYGDDGDDHPGWLTMVFSSEDTPVVRMYSTLWIDLAKVDRLRLLEIINLVNFDFILDGVMDYSPVFNRIRIRDIYRGDGRAINPIEFPSPFMTHVSKVTLWGRVLSRVLFSKERPEDCLGNTVSAVNAELVAEKEQSLRAAG